LDGNKITHSKQLIHPKKGANVSINYKDNIEHSFSPMPSPHALWLLPSCSFCWYVRFYIIGIFELSARSKSRSHYLCWFGIAFSTFYKNCFGQNNLECSGCSSGAWVDWVVVLQTQEKRKLIIFMS